MSTRGLSGSLFLFCLSFTLIATMPARVTRADATLVTSNPQAIEPSKTTRLVLAGTSFSAPLRVWTSCEAQVTVVSVEANQASIDVTPAAGVTVGSIGLWVATAEGPTDVLQLLVDDLPSVLDNGTNHQREQAQEIASLAGIDGTSDGPLSDFYRFHAQAGQRIAFEVHAQRLGSTMDPVMRLLDSAGKQLALTDDDEGDADGRFAYAFKQEGDYVIEVFDSRFGAGGRYRLRVGDFPIITAPMPMAAQLSSRVQCSFVGQDSALVATREVEIPAAHAYDSLAIAARLPDGKSSAWVPMLIRTATQQVESGLTSTAEPLAIPAGISGQLAATNEIDSYQVKGGKGQGVQFAARTRSLGMPTLLQMQLFNAAGAKVAETAVSDADEWSFNFTFPEDGIYRLAVNDLLHRGGTGFGYLIEVGSIESFAVALKPDAKVRERFAIAMEQGAAAIDLQVERTGYEGAIDVGLEPPVAGLEILNPRIDAKAKEARIYFAANKDWIADQVNSLRLIATAVDTPDAKVVVNSLGLRRAKRPTQTYPPAWSLGAVAVTGVAAVPNYFAFEPAASVVFARGQLGHAASLTLKRTQEGFKEAVTVLPYRQMNQWSVTAKPDKDVYAVTWTRGAEAGQPEQISLLTYAEFKGTGRLQSQSIPVTWIDPLKVTIKPLGSVVVGKPQQVQVNLEWDARTQPHPVKLAWQNLPAGWSGAAVDVAADQKTATLELLPSLDFTAPNAALQLLATSVFAGQPLSATSEVVAVNVITAPTKLEVFPTAMQLNDGKDSRRLVVTGFDAAGNARDWTHDCQLVSSNPAVVRIAGNQAIAVADGKAEVTVAAGSIKQTVAVQVTNGAKQHATQFENEVLVALSKQSCNSGACHGSPSGKGGFRLSLRAFDKQLDQLTLLREEFGRRINPLEPEKSLLLQKPLMKVGHGGGVQLHKQDPAYEVLRAWIAEGAKLDPPETARCVKLELYPATKRVLNRVASPTQQIVAIAHYADGTSRDMTHLVSYETSNTSVAEVNASGLVTSHGRGEAAILVRYLEHIESVPIMFVEDVAGFQWQAPTPNNFIDELVNAKLQQLQYLPSATADDSEFLRRVYLDVIGLLPSLEETKSFLADTNADKRKAVIDRLLERPEHAKFWALKWGDLLRMTGKNVGDEGVYKYSRWVEESIRENMPYDEFAKALVTASGSTLSNPPANFYRTATDTNDCVETISQVFLGARLQCAKCHNHPFERWTQDNYYGLGAFFNRIQRKKTQRPGEMFVYTSTAGDVTQPRTGQVMKPWLPQVGDVEAKDENDRRTDFAAWLVSPENAYFARIEANRMWSQLFSRGIVDPIDDFRDSNPPSNGPLLDALAKEFVANKFDRRHLLRIILNSRTYQASYHTNNFNQDDMRYFSHQEPRLLSAEQLLDAVNQTTGTQQTFGNLPAGTKATQLPAPDLVKVDFLKVFGQPERSTVCACERAEDSNLAMAIELFNGPMIYERLRDANNRFRKSLAAGVSMEDTVRELYLAALCRYPSEAELATAVEHSKTRADATSALEDICWALLNTDEFLFQH